MRTVAAVVTCIVVVALGIGALAHPFRSVKRPDNPPLVVIVFDALPESMLMQPDGSLDAARFPGFAELARDATWYRNDTTVHDSTVKSIPAILDGRWPANLRHPSLADHPLNLFTLLRRRYRVWADEEGTALCPPTACDFDSHARLLYLLHGRREQRFAAATAALRPSRHGERPPLWFIHVLLPHEPLRFLPDGKVYEPGADPEPGLDGNESFDDPWLTLQAEQRHLLQLEFTDSLLRGVVARLKETGMYDRAAIVVTADHGISFRRKPTPAEPYRLGQIGWRRDLTRYNAQDVAFVPLFVKAPGQKQGAVSDAWVRSVDIFPTLLRFAGAPVPPGLAGKPLGGPRPLPSSLHVLTNRRGPLVLDPTSMERRRAATIERRARRFGTGDDADRLFRIGPHAELIGRPLATLRVLPQGNATVRLWGPRRFEDVAVRGRRLPAQVTGWVRGVPPGRAIAVALNGRIAAVAPTFRPIGRLGLSMSALVPQSAFRDGDNEIRVFELVSRGREVALRPLREPA